MNYGKKHDLPFGIMDVAGLLRLNIRRRAPGQVYVDCPICGDRRGKMNLNTAKDLWRCNYCGEGGGMLSLYAKVYGVSNSDAYREICDALAVNGFSPDYTVPEKTMPAEAEQSDAASVQEVHQTLSMLLSMLTLIPAHRAHLQSVRGLSDDEITRFGFKSTPPPFLCRSLTNRLVKAGCRVQGVPGFYVDDNGCWTVKFHQRTSGIIIPIFGVDGLIRGAQIRLDHPLKDKDDPPEKTGVKYLTLSSTGKRMGTTSGSPIHFVGDPCSRVVYVTEGCLKADVAHALMHRTFVATLGVNNTAKLDELFAFLHRNGTEEIIEAEDMDKYSNEMVEKGASKIYALAARHGMRCRRLTWNPNYTTQYTYDGVGNLTKITDALGKSTVSEYDANGNLTATTDRNGHTTRYAYDAENRLIRMEDAEGSTTSYTYDANGQMTKTTSAMGAETSSTYDALGRQISSADALGHVTGYEYDVLGRATKITYADGGFVAYTYDANGQVLTATDELGGVISYAYDANGRLIEMTDAMGGKTAYAYDAVGNVTSVTDALGGSTTYRYDETGNMTSATDANGNTTGYSYDALGRAVAVTDANGGVTRAEYDHNGNIVKAVDAEGNATTYVYDALDRLASYTNAEGYTFSFQYDNEGNTVSSTDGNGNTTRYTYDGLNRAVSSTNAEGNTAYNTYDADGRMVKSVNEEGAETAYAYDADGRLISMTDALGNVTSFEYDSRDRVIKVTDAKGNATTFTYDLAGNVKSETNAKGVVTSYAYDANGNLTSMTDAAGTVTYIYDALNRVTSVKDRRGNTQFFTYDATDRIVQVKDRNGNATRYVYDGNGNIVKTIDALGTESVFTYNKNDQLISTDLHRVDALNGVDSHEITLYEYDGRNLVTKEINALGDSTVYVYDGNGNLVSKTDADGYVTRYSYTVLDLVKKINYNGAKEVSYQYNKVGELVQMDDWTGTNTFELDLLGRLQKMTDHKGNTVSYTYDAVGNQTGITYPDGSKTRSFYDAVYNLTSVIDADDGTYAYVYDDANRPVKLTYPNGWIEQYTYDAEGNLLKTVDTDPFQLYNKTPKVKYEYTYDAEGNVLTEFQRDSDATENLKSRTTFTYDALNRLTGSTRKLEVYPYDTLAYSYSYDTLGNLLKQSGPTKGEEDTYQYNDLNQMVSKHVCGYEQKLTRIYDYGYTYDKRGNLVKEEEICSPTTTGPKNITIATYLYDETNRMVRGTNKTGEVSAYTFNGLGVRVGTELILEDNSHGYTDFHCQTPSVETGIEKPEVVKTDYVIDYTRLDIDQRVLVKSEQDGYDFFYTYGLDKLQVMTIGEGSNWWGQSIKKCVNMAYVHTDRLGSVVNLSDQYGRVTARADYTDWGEVRRYTDITVDGGFRRLLPEITYATHEYDDVLNQFYAKARMYDAENKRFDAVDPVKGFIADPTTLVQYLYVEDNAVNQVDPTGRTPLMAVGALAGGIINAAVTAYQSKKETGHISISKTAVSFVEGAITGATLGSNLGAVAVGVISGVTAAAASVARDKIDNSNGEKISKWQMATNAIVSGVVSGVTAGLIGGPGAKAPITRTGIKIVNQQFGMGTVKSFITQPTQRVISKNFAMGVVKTAIIAPINAAISSNVIKKLSEVSAVSLTDAKKASVTNSNATNNNYFMKVACTH